MALNEQVLGTALRLAVQSVSDPQDNQDEIYKQMAKAIIDHLVAFGVINTVVATAGTAAAQAGTGVGKIS